MIDIKDILNRKNVKKNKDNKDIPEVSLEQKAALQAVANSIIGSTISSKPAINGAQ